MPQFAHDELSRWTGGTWSCEPAGAIDGVSSDTRTLGPGAIFIALHGEHHDGEDYVAAAFDKGAVAAMVSDAFPDDTGSGGRALLRVPDVGSALCRMASGYRDAVAPRLTGVTGSVGKSTVKEMLAAMLATSGETACTAGNWNNEIGLPLSLLGMARSTEFGVFELGTNHPGEMKELCSILRPSWAIVTNIGPVHLEFFDSVAAIAREKACLIQGLPADGTSVLNLDSGYAELLRSMAPGPVLTFSMTVDADYRLLERDPTSRTIVVLERDSGDRIELDIAVPGEFQVANALAAIAAARGHGVDWPDIAGVLAVFKPMAMRWEERTIHGIRFVNDAYNANPVSMRAALRAFEEAFTGRKWLILADMLELGAGEADEHRELGEFVAGSDWQGIVTLGERGRGIAEGAAAAGMAPELVHSCADHVEAASAVRMFVEPGDAVLLKGSRGMHLETILDLVDDAGSKSRDE